MKAELRNIESPDISDLSIYWPEEETNFCFYLELLIGAKGQEGEEIFGITVCTPQWLLENYKPDDILFLRHYLIVFKYDYPKILKALKARIESLSAENWNELAEKISRIGYWEFEDYKSFPS